VRDPQYFDDASAVAHETMRRARHNVEQIIEKLRGLGYRFTLGPEAYKPADSSAIGRLDDFEGTIGGPLPLSIRHWWEQMEFVCLAGLHETLTPSFDVDATHPLTIWDFSDEDRELIDLTERGQTGFQLALERDAYAIRVPDWSADVNIGPDRLWFVPYLREVSQWGGFPGWANAQLWPTKFPIPIKELSYLREELLLL